MKVNIITPQGYCRGVEKALKILDEAIDNPNTLKPIYLLGEIIHNKHVINDYINKGVIVLNDKTKTKLELLDEINEGTVVFSAHGVSDSVYQKAKEKKLNIIDATCPNVLIVHEKIKKYLNSSYDCIYIGTLNHPECEGILGISDKINFISNINDVDKLNIRNSKIYVTNQTTLSLYDLKNIFDKIKDKYPNAIIEDKICNATTIRQQAVATQEKVDLCIVVGDLLSSNTKKLAKVASDICNIKTILCEDLTSLDKDKLKNCSNLSITSGASTPSYIVDEIIEYIKNIR